MLGREFAIETLSNYRRQIPYRGGLRPGTRPLRVLFERAEPSETTFVFRHALTQDVAYGTLLSDRRARYHAAAGAAIATQHRSPFRCCRTARSSLRPQRHDDQAVRFGLMAAENAQHRWANDQALTYFGLSCVGSTRCRLRRTTVIRIDAVIGQAEVMFALGDTPSMLPRSRLCGLVESVATIGGKRRGTTGWGSFRVSSAESRRFRSLIVGKPPQSRRAGLDDLLALFKLLSGACVGARRRLTGAIRPASWHCPCSRGRAISTGHAGRSGA